ncbi:pentatricopeptide repeat-containing protein At5g43790 [Carica papaya]|uniref:pentatricopeptide repeat-containing protein At5g43790 n=1 Tax=Carica papaya TaxID=3649 RepID=UPI000B8CDC83|nr:pentatricopeptide repeat-containing protein At5g43790 [Carica papaya]
MVSSNPIFKHQALQLLEKCNTVHSFKQVHAQAITNALVIHTYPLSRLLLLSSTLAFSYALSIFNQIPNPTVFLYNTFISSSTHNASLALFVYNKILTHQDHTLKPNVFTYPSLFKACGFPPWLNHGRALHAHVLKFLQPPYDHFVQASLINFYANSGKLGVARYLFSQISKPDLPTWNSILGAYARCPTSTASSLGAIYSGDSDSNRCIEVLWLFKEMQKSPVKPNELTLVAVISACANLGAFSQGAWAHAYVTKCNLKLNRFVGTGLIDMYSKCGFIDFAYQLFEKMPQKDTLCYNAMIGGFGMHGYGYKALHLYEKMKSEGFVPDDITFVVVMRACSHVGLLEDGCRIFESIKEYYRIEPKQEHYGCLVDLLGRAGRLKEAEEEIRKMPMQPNAVLWRSLLGAARVHGNLEIGEMALKHLLRLEPETSGNYVLLSNIYASIHRWGDVKRIRKLMKDQGVDKMPGSSLVEVNGIMHEFFTGDRTHPYTKEIYGKLEEINTRLQEYGHKPRTKQVLFDIEEEEKEDALSYHSERLAIAFAFVVSNSNLPIRIIKNLRVCVDCHAITKLLSTIYRREIVVRDRNRFHHFKGGTCSCVDYW